jgi:hypothetical protein
MKSKRPKGIYMPRLTVINKKLARQVESQVWPSLDDLLKQIAYILGYVDHNFTGYCEYWLHGTYVCTPEMSILDLHDVLSLLAKNEQLYFKKQA